MPWRAASRFTEAIEYAVSQQSFIGIVGAGGVVVQYEPPEALAQLVADEMERRTKAVELLGLEMQ